MTETTWIRSSFCGGGGNNCVEVAFGDRQDDVAIRDSVHPARVITASPGAFAAFLTELRTAPTSH